MSSTSALARVVKVIPNRTAFLVCDLQERMHELIPNFPPVVNTAAKMIRMAEVLQVPVIITEQTPKVFKATVPEILQRHNALPQDLRHGPFLKTTFAMRTPEVEAVLKQKDIQTVVLFGVETHVCVLQTALDMLESGRDVHVLADGVSSVNHEEVDVAIARMRQAGAQITTSESILFQLLADPKFRAFNKISKEERDKSSESLRTVLGNERPGRIPKSSL